EFLGVHMAGDALLLVPGIVRVVPVIGVSIEFEAAHAEDHRALAVGMEAAAALGNRVLHVTAVAATVVAGQAGIGLAGVHFGVIKRDDHGCFRINTQLILKAAAVR